MPLTKTSAKATEQEQQNKKGIPIERAFLRVFQNITKKMRYVYTTLEELKKEPLSPLIKAATAKCVDFNILANRSKTKSPGSFVLMSSLRGICEDLIYLSYLSTLKTQDAGVLIMGLQRDNLARGIEAQRNFFASNNPAQPVIGAGLSADESAKRLRETRDEIRAFWKSIGVPRYDGPSIRELASKVGLTSTYEYIYFASSNFVHFNPHALFRTGWGPLAGPFRFSIFAMDPYYQMSGSFYGAIMFLGFESAFGQRYLRLDLSKETEKILYLIDHVQRWPEVVTFEEMNKKAPLYLLTHALGQVMRKENPATPYGAILQEVQNLKDRVGPT